MSRLDTFKNSDENRKELALLVEACVLRQVAASRGWSHGKPTNFCKW